MSTLEIGWGRPRLEDRIRQATAALRGAALAVAATAAAVQEQLAVEPGCAQDDVACLEDAYADLLRHKHRVRLATREVARLEQTSISYDGRTPTGAPSVGWHIPSVAAARRMVDRANDVVAEALTVANETMASIDRPANADA